MLSGSGFCPGPANFFRFSPGFSPGPGINIFPEPGPGRNYFIEPGPGRKFFASPGPAHFFQPLQP